MSIKSTKKVQKNNKATFTEFATDATACIIVCTIIYEGVKFNDKLIQKAKKTVTKALRKAGEACEDAAETVKTKVSKKKKARPVEEPDAFEEFEDDDFDADFLKMMKS